MTIILYKIYTVKSYIYSHRYTNLKNKTKLKYIHTKITIYVQINIPFMI